MTFDEAYLRLSEPFYVNGWLSEEEARLLWTTAAATEGPILEVGSYHGRSTILLAGLGRLILSVDPFEGFDDTDPTGEKTLAAFQRNLAARDIRTVNQYRLKVEEWTPRRCGFAYLDGDHTEAGTLRQIEVARQCGVQTMCLHDYEGNGGGWEIVRAVSEAGLEVLEVAGRLAHCRSK